MKPHLALFLIAFTACTAQPEAPPPREATPNSALPGPVALVPASEAAAGQTIYVPVYSHIYYRDDRRVINLATTLSIRNTDANDLIFITAVRYYDTEGALVRHYVEEPLQLGPMASTDFVVEKDDTSGGSGANFIVAWQAEQTVTAPVVEAVMVSTSMGQGISIVTEGRVLEKDPSETFE